MKETSDPTPEEEVILAKKALAEGKLKRALYHVAGALETDPGRQEWLGLLDRVLAASRDPLQLTPAEKDAEPADAAVHCHILAHAGKAAEAVERLLELIAARPAAVRYLAWAVAWLDAPEAAGALDMRRVNAFLDAWLQRFPGLVLDSEEARRRLKPLLPFARKIDQTQATDELFLAAHAALLRKSGRLDEARAVAEQAYQNQPGYPTALALAQAHEAKGDTERGCALTQEALRFKPDDVAARLEMGDRLWGRGRLDDAERWYKEALQRDPQHPWARPSYFALRYEMNQDEGWRNKLIEYARANPANERARDLVVRLAPYVGALPTPGDATIKVAWQLLEQFAHGPPAGPVSVTLNWLEAPSARLAVDLQARVLGLNLTFDYAVEKLQTPDPRKPRRPVEYQLWKYKGNNPSPAVPAPPPQTAEAVAGLAREPYGLAEWARRATELGPRLGPGRVEELLGVMVHPPLPPPGTPAWTWLQHVQVAAALVLAHVDAGWKGAARRKALFALANGPLDWTVGAAIIALTHVAQHDPAARDEITRLFVELMKAMPRQGYVPYAHALVCCLLTLPNVSDKERATLKEWRRDLENA